MNKPTRSHIVDNYATDRDEARCGRELPCARHWPNYKPGDLTSYPEEEISPVPKIAHHETRSGLHVEVVKRDDGMYEARAITQCEQFCWSEGRSSDWQALVSLAEELRHMVRSVEELAHDRFELDGKDES